jgi:hypothetical protein
MAVGNRNERRSVVHVVCTAGGLAIRSDGYYPHVSGGKQRGVFYFFTISLMPTKATHIIRTVYV